MDVVIPYKKTDSDELIYALRSLANIRHGKVFIIGDNPNLQRVDYIPFRQTSDIGRNTHDIMTLACNTPEVSDSFIWMADDMYFMRKMLRIPVLHRGYYDDILQTHRRRLSNYYIRRMANTNHYLKSLGIEKPLCYEVHVPFVINRARWIELNIPHRFNKLSAYANLCNLGGSKISDVKVRNKDIIPRGSFASSYDKTFGSNKLGERVRELFPERSIYEK